LRWRQVSVATAARTTESSPTLMSPKGFLIIKKWASEEPPGASSAGYEGNQ